MRSLLMLCALLTIGFMPLRASAEAGATPATSIIQQFLSTPTPILYSVIPAPTGTTGSRLLHQAQGCQACRNSCSIDRADCEDSDGRNCQSQFVRCMRVCWKEDC
jgi:hypothetical protein